MDVWADSRARAAPRREERLGRSLKHHVAAAGLAAAGTGAGEALYAAVPSVWTPGALSLAALIISPLRLWPALLLGSTAGSLMMSDAFGNASAVYIPLYTSIGAAAYLLLRTRAPDPFESYAQLARFLLLAAIALPLLGTALMSGSTSTAWWRDSGPALNRFVAHSLGYLLVLPAVVAPLVQNFPRRAVSELTVDTAVAVGLLLAAAAAWTLTGPSQPWHHLTLLAPLPLLVWALLRFGPAGVLYSQLVVSLLGSWLIARHESDPPLPSAANGVLEFELWNLGSAVAVLVLLVVSEKHRQTHRRLETARAGLATMNLRMRTLQEEERARIARELHDDLNQTLASIAIRMSRLRAQAPDELRAELALVQEQLAECSHKIRNISHALHPALLRYMGLGSALAQLCSASSHPALEVRCEVNEVPRMHPDLELNLYRIAQEAVDNIQRHARAATATVSLTMDGADVVLRVEDAGIGFPSDGGAMQRGIGLIGMAERVAQFAGQIRFSQAPSGGAAIEVRVAALPPGEAIPTRAHQQEV